MGGAGPAFGTDSSGSSWIYLTTGNGTFDGVSYWGDSLLKLDPTNLTVANGGTGYFTPADQNYRGNDSCSPPGGYDLDFGPSGPMLFPDSEVANYGYLSVHGDKEGYLWFLDRTSPGRHLTGCDSLCSCPSTYQDTNVVEKYPVDLTKQFHNNAAYWELASSQPTGNFIYAGQFEGGALTQYNLCANPSTPPPTNLVCTSVQATDPPVGARSDGYGATPSISASSPDAATDAVVWAIIKTDFNMAEGTKPGLLYAYDALTMAKLYASSDCNIGGILVDSITSATKFSVPTIANGFVYVGAQGGLDSNGKNNNKGMFFIFGSQNPRRTC